MLRISIVALCAATVLGVASSIRNASAATRPSFASKRLSLRPPPASWSLEKKMRQQISMASVSRDKPKPPPCPPTVIPTTTVGLGIMIVTTNSPPATTTAAPATTAMPTPAVTQAPAPLTTQAPTTTQSLTCALATTCGQCTDLPECGWCALEHKCVGGSKLGPNDASSACRIFAFTECRSVSCSHRTSCNECVLDPDCGWCASSQACSAGDALGSFAGHGCVLGGTGHFHAYDKDHSSISWVPPGHFQGCGIDRREHTLVGRLEVMMRTSQARVAPFMTTSTPPPPPTTTLTTSTTLFATTLVPVLATTTNEFHLAAIKGGEAMENWTKKEKMKYTTTLDGPSTVPFKTTTTTKAQPSTIPFDQPNVSGAVDAMKGPLQPCNDVPDVVVDVDVCQNCEMPPEDNKYIIEAKKNRDAAVDVNTGAEEEESSGEEESEDEKSKDGLLLQVVHAWKSSWVGRMFGRRVGSGKRRPRCPDWCRPCRNETKFEEREQVQKRKMAAISRANLRYIQMAGRD